MFAFILLRLSRSETVGSRPAGIANALQIESVLPLLLTFGQASADSTEMAFAAVLPQLQMAAHALQELTLLVVNLVSQLGALCSEQTRKSTVISGITAQFCLVVTLCLTAQ